MEGGAQELAARVLYISSVAVSSSSMFQYASGELRRSLVSLVLLHRQIISLTPSLNLMLKLSNVCTFAGNVMLTATCGFAVDAHNSWSQKWPADHMAD